MSGPFLQTARERYRPFLSKAPGSDAYRFICDLRDDPLSSTPQASPEVTLSPSGSVACISHQMMFSDIRLLERRGSVVLSRLPNVLDNFLRIFSTLALLKRRGFLSHSAGLRIDGNGYLFPGPSGSGKSTLARKAGVPRLLSDELTGVALSGRRALLMGTPFWGSFQKGRLNATCPLKGIYFLNKHAPYGARKIAKDEALVRLMGTVLFFTSHPDANDSLLKHATRIVESVPTYEFNYNKDRERFRQIRARLNAGD